jgi:hypothetical protein
MGSRRRYISVLTVLGALAAASEVGFADVGRKYTHPFRNAVGRATGMSKGPFRAIACLITGVLTSKGVDHIAGNRLKLPLGRSGLKL